MMTLAPFKVLFRVQSLFGGMVSGDRISWRQRAKSFCKRIQRKFITPKVTISAFTETGQEESSIVVPLQRAYTGRKPVIPSRLADTPCATLGVQGLLDQLNITLRTSHTLIPSLSSLLEECIKNNYDFGMVYGRLRQVWYTRDWSTIRDTLREWEDADRRRRRNALGGNRIVQPDLPPRRVWDLCSNRVVPWWCTGIGFMSDELRPISHAWMNEKDRVDVQTPINGYEWPVPIPKDASLNLVRIEILNLRVEQRRDYSKAKDHRQYYPATEYAWLDVLCLRQEGGPGEDMRAEEWKLDVPTIGAVYSQNRVVWYLSGLGRPLSLKDGDLDSDRCWFRRAWTLQELGYERVIAGDTPDGPMHAECKYGKYETELLTRFHKQLQSMEDISNSRVFDVLEEMRNRVSTNPVDKVAGLAFVLRSKTIPAYYETESLEDAWTALVYSMDSWTRRMLFLSYPEPGNAGRKWTPSWDQLMMKPLPVGGYSLIDLDRNEEMGEDSCYAECIEKGCVRGLDQVAEGSDRRGELIVQGKYGTEHLNITATHKYPIPDNTYTLICDYKLYSTSCIVGRRLPGKRFEKVSVLQIPNRYRWRRVENLYITEKCRNILV
ncbi:uncharacterized protein EV420DRAFT_330307 [Desarmillaria tabescens]|uniref:Heterokaryon incompatibility domain-containing protein n=1 Tax=Armillaria tabescens TaxID=1929756 RepID=A0AA39KFC4_ARMTA|nr:uncharacterized protein EV420DRAFT_330307 [Desarmillaria tabescens]KAK0458754.1 hypothetical protein EV420DRAFT_330307 [Desarmillaria tabescens]